MTTIEKSLTVEVPVSTAYNQWTQFETFPQFMDGVEQVHQMDDTHLHWKAKIAGVSREWEAEIFEQTPDSRVAWRATDGTQNQGAVSFAEEQPMATRVTLRMQYEPEGMMEKAGDAMNVVERQVESDLQRFKTFIEGRGAETGAWRDDV